MVVLEPGWGERERERKAAGGADSSPSMRDHDPTAYIRLGWAFIVCKKKKGNQLARSVAKLSFSLN